MKITWYGHAAFKIELDGRRVIMDPYRSPDCGGFGPIDDGADLVIVSHENDRYHSHLGQIRRPFEVVRAHELRAGTHRVQGLDVEAIPCFETPEKLPGDEVTVVQVSGESLRVVHLGDLGHALDEEQLERLKGAPVVLAAAGGPPTIALEQVGALLAAIGPRVVIPMHYLVPGKIDLAIQPIERFLEALPGWSVERPGSSSIELAAGSLGEPRIVVLEPAR